MKRFIVIAVMTFTLLTLVPATAGAQLWHVSTEQNFAFIGDEVTVLVAGLPNVGVQVRLESPTGFQIMDRFVMISNEGSARFNFTVPYDLQSGVYSLVLLYQGEVVDEYKMEIVFDGDLYNQFMIEQLQEDIEREKQRVIEYGKLANEAVERLKLIFWLALASITGGMWAVFFTALKLKDVHEYVEGKRVKTRLARGVYNMIHPPACGRMDSILESTRGRWPHVKEKRRKARGDVVPTNAQEASPEPEKEPEPEIEEVIAMRSMPRKGDGVVPKKAKEEKE